MRNLNLNLALIRYVFGVLLLMESLFMAVSTLVAVWYAYRCGDTDWPALAVTTAVTAAAGAAFWWSGRKHPEGMAKREGYLIVALAWVLFSVFGMLPYLIYGTCTSVADAFFETMSGFTTTGCTVLGDIDAQPHGILFWRSMTHWLGGLGIVVFSLSLLPLLGSGATMMYDAETTGLSVSKLRPKIQSTARRLWGIYLVFTVVCTLLLWAGPVSLFDAVNLAFSTIATGGFAPHQASLGHYQSAYVEYVCAVFLFICSLNFSLYYLFGVGKWRLFWRDEEFRWFCLIVALETLGFMALVAYTRQHAATTPEQLAALGDPAFEPTFRMCFFHVMSIISSGGLQAEHYDYDLWGQLFWLPSFTLMAIGGCAGSTAGGLKVVRVVVLFKNLGAQFRQALRPREISTVRLNGHSLSQETLLKVMAMFAMYVLLIFFSVFLLQWLGLDFKSAIGTSISAFSNTGPALGSTGPAFTWGDIPDVGKWYLSVAMLVGRLEIFTVVLLFTRLFWRR